jgi:putative membrane protein
MNARTYRFAQIAILLGLGVYLLVKIVSGTLYYYINERFLWLVAFGAIAFLVLGLVTFSRKQHAHSHDHGHGDGHTHAEEAPGGQWSLFVLAVPLLLGFLVPAKPLDSSALESRGLTTNALLSVGQGQSDVQLELPSDQRTVLDWIRAFNFATDPGMYAGEPVDLIGFVYHDPRLPDGQMLVSRFAVSCCVADAFAIGVIVETDEEWAGNTWVHVTGEMQVGTLDDRPYPLVIASDIKEVAVPPQPYLFP